ncbi:MAG: putative DNA modification/repair radical SAM protein [Roseateles sp.]|uniref:putative DNA modification/repair radical SAM protein n=1 Tax=Roseateles sp. TaxID=1971397 RepID=UPI0040354B31
MDVNDKLAVLADAAKYDASCASSGGDKRDSRDGRGIGSTTGAGICHAFTPDGRCVSLLKVLLTNWCVYDCLYCINRKSSDVRRARFSIDEIVQLTLSFYRRNVIEGLFLSSGIIRTPDYTMEQVIEVARRLREQEHFKGYIHLKTIPDASAELVELAGRYADRLSINVELPSAASLKQLAPEKNADGIERTMSRIHLRLQAAKEARREAEAVRALPGANARAARPAPFAPAGQSTQLIVGADASDDRAVLQLSNRLYRGQGLRRVYYSAYSPIPHASSQLPPRAAPLLREHRLYQADWLMRFYGFSADEIVTEAGFLSLQHDPKLAWALAHPASFPLDVDRAPREQLLRVPGLGVGSVDKLPAARQNRRLRRADLLALGPAAKRALPFLVAVDHRPRVTDLQMLARPAAQPQQATLF